MRILYLTDSFRPARSACANRTVVLVEALRNAGNDVQVLASSDSLLGAPSDYEKPDYVTFFETYPLRDKTLMNRLKNNFGGRRASIKAANCMGDFDVVVCTTPPLLLLTSAMAIARQKHAKLVWDVRDVWPDVAYEMGSFKPSSPYGRFFTHIANKGYKRASLVLSVSAGKVDKLRSRMPDGRADAVRLIPNGIDEAFLNQEQDRTIVDRLRMDVHNKICVYVGNIGLAQGLGTLLDIASTRQDIHFLIFGDGADKSKLVKRVADEGLSNVEFCGTVDARGVYTVLHHATISYIPLVSSKLKDSIPTKLYEALACGCPVLLAAEGDSVALLKEAGLGVSAAPENADELQNAFAYAIDNKWTPEERGRAMACMRVEHSRQKFAHDFASYIAELENEPHVNL